MDREQIKEHLRFAAELGVDGVSRDPAWRSRPEGMTHGAGRTHGSGPPGDAVPDVVGADPRVGPSPLAFSKNAAEALAAVRADIGDCTRCKLHRLGRRQIVFGVGNPNADLMFVGEAPGGDEDIQGIPFVGRAGQLLTKIIEAIGLRREDVYIANVIKCRPPENRNPEPDEVDSCEPFLLRQLELIGPEVILALGKFAVQTLLRVKTPITQLRGRWYDYHGIKLMPTFHPAYLLRNPGDKRLVWQDIQKVMRVLGIGGHA